jgi:hypothetical protein
MQEVGEHCLGGEKKDYSSKIWCGSSVVTPIPQKKYQVEE